MGLNHGKGKVIKFTGAVLASHCKVGCTLGMRHINLAVGMRVISRRLQGGHVSEIFR